MNIDHEIWIHGSSVVIQEGSTVDSITRKGGSAIIKGKLGTTLAWFHLPISSPILIDGSTLLVKSVKVMVDGSPTAGVAIDCVDLWDGNNRINRWLPKFNVFAFGNIHKFDIAEDIEVNYGLNISLGVAFHAHTGSGEFELIGAGCEFTKQQTGFWPSITYLAKSFLEKTSKQPASKAGDVDAVTDGGK